MFKVESSILDFFKLILRILLELAPDGRNKGLGITKVQLKERVKLFSEYRDSFLFFESITMLVLCLLKANNLIEEKNSK